MQLWCLYYGDLVYPQTQTSASFIDGVCNLFTINIHVTCTNSSQYSIFNTLFFLTTNYIYSKALCKIIPILHESEFKYFIKILST